MIFGPLLRSFGAVTTGGGDTIINVLPLQSNVPSNTITPSGDTVAYQFSPLPTGPIAIFQSDGVTPLNLAGADVRMYCVCLEFKHKTFTLKSTVGSPAQLVVGGTSSNQISVNYVPQDFGRFWRRTWYKPSGGSLWYPCEEGYWQIVQMPNPATL